jgi:hypothetical protein
MYSYEPEYSCPEIDRNIEILDDAKEHLKEALGVLDTKAHNPIGDALDELIGPMEPVDVVFLDSVHNVVDEALGMLGEDRYDGLEEGFEYCRSQCEDIRSWGHEWKEEAERMEDQEQKVTDLEYEVEDLESKLADRDEKIEELEDRIAELEEERRAA